MAIMIDARSARSKVAIVRRKAITVFVSGHGANEDIVLFNPGWWASLPQDYRDVIVAAFDEVRPKVEEIKEASQEAALQRLTEAGMNVRELTDEERAALRETMYPRARDAYLGLAGDAGQAIVDVYEEQYADVTGE